jgi:single-strand DNA-binding protein
MSKGMRVVATGRMEQKDWVDKEGNKRTSYDLVLDEIGPSLRWATAVVTKTDKNGSGSSSPSIVAASAAFNALVVEEDPF